MIEGKYCVVANHEKLQCHHICIFKDCDFDVKWVCSECLKSKRHQHGLDNENHIVNQQDFKKQINSINIVINEQENQMNKNLKVKNEISQQIQQLEQYLNECLEYKKLINHVLHKIDHNFSMIENQQIQKIFSKAVQFDQKEVAQIIKMIESLCQQSLSQQIGQQDYQPNINIINQQPIKHFQKQEMFYLRQELDRQLQQILKGKQTKYEFYNQFDSPQCIYDAQISQNEKYLAYGGDYKELTIYDLQTGEKKQAIKLEQSIQTCCFREAAEGIYVGCEDGHLYWIDFANDVHFKFKERLHNDMILNIIELNDNQVITGSDKTINLQISKTEKAPPDLYFTGLDGNKNWNIIVTGLSNYYIRIYDLEFRQQLEKVDASFKPLNSIKFFDNHHIVTQDTSQTLKLWKLDLNNKSLTFTKKETKKEGEVLNFGCSQIHNKIVIISKQWFCIFDQSLQNPQVIKHTKNYDVKLNRVQQLQSLNYIIILGSKSLEVMKKIEE